MPPYCGLQKAPPRRREFLLYGSVEYLFPGNFVLLSRPVYKPTLDLIAY